VQHCVSVTKGRRLLVQMVEGKTAISVQLGDLRFDVLVVHRFASTLEKGNTFRELLDCFLVSFFLEVKIATLLNHTDLV